ncbi:hypothetical protein PHLGIDRAFT_176210 [Phlebiopsis gigantea 11061_1 CR5-6]|uniref:FAD-binding domain-containing protein n=1 Tax=Phlebiopsis gigantea (strain 11061_1 CR5-6) TaxID=745531 RepID=A0A0C3PGL9_PHLG1|nr:hypothetical protein PHLGIDRAFT_176210 [Phlebiopsis gigantea 11061_1 CR5-6]
MTVPQAKESTVDVLIIGAGPAGLMAANALAKAGVHVRIVDQRPAKVAAGQADGIQPRVIEVLQSYGLADRLLREGNQMHLATFYNPGPDGGIERTGRAPDVTAPSARWPFYVTLHQGSIEAMFLDSMAPEGVTVERPVIPTLLEVSKDESVLKDPQSHAVKVVLKYLDPEQGQADIEIVRAKYVLGADGAHSWVRKALGIAMEGEQTNYIWGVVDIIPDTDFPDIRTRTSIHSLNGSCMIVPREGDMVRLYLQLMDADVVNPETGRVDRDKMGPEKLMKVASKTFHPYSIRAEEYHWWTLYIIGQRVAAQYSAHERVFISGDACHTHSPKAGQGMNASINDSHNLAWKIAHVVRGWSDMSILKTYELERRKFAQDLINFDKMFAAMFSSKPRTAQNKDGVTHEEFIAAFQGGFTTGVGIHYSPSVLVNADHQAHASKLVIGERVLPQTFIRAADMRPYEIQDLLPADTRYKVLVFAGDTSDAAQLARVRTLAAAVGSPSGFFKTYGGADVFDILTISSASKEKVNYTDVPPIFRSHWSKVLLDDTEMYPRTDAGGGYEKYGIDKTEGAVVVVRPDQYVGIVAPFEKLDDITDYFAAFMKVAAQTVL